MVNIMRILTTKQTPEDNGTGLYVLQVYDCGTIREHRCDEAGYKFLLAQTEIYTLLVSKNCTEREIQGVLDRISDLQAASFQEGVNEGIEAGYDQATVDPDRG